MLITNKLQAAVDRKRDRHALARYNGSTLLSRGAELRGPWGQRSTLKSAIPVDSGHRNREKKQNNDDKMSIL